MRRSCLPLGLLTLVTCLLALSHVVHAQTRPDTTASDTTPGVAASKATPAFWVAVGAGKGKLEDTGGSLTTMIRLNYSSGLVLLTYRASDTGPLESGDGVREDAFLIGVRSPNPRVFGGAAIGVASALPYHKCSCESPPSARPREFGLAYDLSSHANARVIGVAFGVAGVAGPAEASYHAVTVSVELGRFGP